MLTTLCFDADDTLWHNERFFRMTQDHFTELLSNHADPDHLAERLLEAERRNIGRYGFGIKGFVLSMVETALDVTENKVSGDVVREIIEAGQDMLEHPIELLPGVEETITQLSNDHHLVVITKGDLLDQERKIAQSGLGDLFDNVEIVSEKTEAVYAGIFERLETPPDRALMAGNSMRSDVVPVLQAGGWAVHVPHELEWEIEAAETPADHDRYRSVTVFSEIPNVIRQINNKM
ncbi:MAG: HAD family hydrolase [Boseongicola sp.]|nr:HAD family hydrolase [Boseongicola sp.]MDD9976427.1 HAD family hydrolase [Boseongicola sp.]